MRCKATVTAFAGNPCGEGTGTEEGKTFACLEGSECIDAVCVPYPAAGEPCRIGRCSLDSSCVRTNAAPNGTCRPIAKQGESCAVVGLPCETNLYCDGAVCKARGKAGDACTGGGHGPDDTATGTCETGHYCDGVVCKAFGKTGELCPSDAVCRSGKCSTSGRCEAIEAGSAIAPFCK